MAWEVNRFLGRVFAERRKDGRTELEAIESALRAALHQAGAAALSELLQFETPAADQRQLPCGCGHHAQYQEIRCKPVLTIAVQHCVCTYTDAQKDATKKEKLLEAPFQVARPARFARLTI